MLTYASKLFAPVLVVLLLVSGASTSSTLEHSVVPASSQPNFAPAVEHLSGFYAEARAEQQERSFTAAGARLTAEADDYFRLQEALAAQEAARLEAERKAAEEEQARLQAEEEARQEAERLEQERAAQEEEQAQVRRLQEELNAMGYQVAADGDLGENTRAALAQAASDSGVSLDEGQSPTQLIEALEEMRESGHQRIFTTNVWTHGSQAELDLCKGAVVTRYWQRTVGWENGERLVATDDPGIPWIAEHNYCGASGSTRVPVGGHIKLTGLHAGTYRIVSEKTVIYGRATPLAADDMEGDYIFQTCYDDFDSSGRMRLAGLVKVG